MPRSCGKMWGEPNPKYRPTTPVGDTGIKITSVQEGALQQGRSKDLFCVRGRGGGCLYGIFQKANFAMIVSLKT